jgi:hypothetical protein
MVMVRAANLCVSWLRGHSTFKTQLHMQFLRFHTNTNNGGLRPSEMRGRVRWLSVSRRSVQKSVYRSERCFISVAC